MLPWVEATSRTLLPRILLYSSRVMSMSPPSRWLVMLCSTTSLNSILPNLSPNTPSVPSSISCSARGNGTTFPKNLTRWEEVQRGLAVLSDSVAMRLRQQGLYCGGVSVSLRNAQFRTVSRQMRLPAPTHLMKDIWQAAMELTRRLWKAPEPVRMLTVTALYITDSADSFQQLDLLEAPVVTQQQEKQEKLERTMDAIRGKYGRASISFGLPGEERAGWDD